MNTRLASLAVLIAISAAACGGCKEPESTPDAGADLAQADLGDAGAPDAGDLERAAILAVPESAAYTLPTLSRPVHVVRTAGNVPHIYAQTLHDAYVAAGFVIATDRYFELDIASRLATGEVSSLLGGFGLSADIDARGRGLLHVAERLLASLDEDTGAMLDAFAEGVNAYADAARAGVLPAPSEYELAAPLVGKQTGAELLRDMDRRAIAAFAAFAIYESSFTDHDIGAELVAQSLEGHFAGAPLEALRQAGIEQDFFPDVRPRHEVAVVDGWGLNGTLPRTQALRVAPATAPRPIPRLPPGLAARLGRKSAAQNLWFGTRDSGDKGSNAWAVSGASTANGASLIAGDGHLALGVPTLFLQMGVDVRTFGDDPLRVMGLYLPGIPTLAVGTNGDIAWSQTYPRADVMDWYREELQLDANGMPQASFFQGNWEPLVRIDETYNVGPVLTDDPYVATWPRWTTFDGRFLREVEGREVEDIETEVLAPGESIIATASGFVVPADEDGDGVITAVSLDFTAFDTGNMLAIADGFQRATSVAEFLGHTKSLVGYAQNLVVADRNGNIGYTNFSATPCRGYLPRAVDGRWADGADPQRLLDGTLYGAFEVPTAAGAVVFGDPDPQRCMIDYEVFPRVERDSGHVVNANNDPAGATFDNSLTNDPAYIGGPWYPAYRARAIVDGLDAAIARGATLEDMADVQNAQRSLVGLDLAPTLIGALERGAALQTADPASLTEAEIRARDLYAPRATELAEVRTRLDAWLAAGAVPASGVETFYHSPDAQDRDDAVATMIFNAWLRQFIAAVFVDENIDLLLNYPGRSREAMMRALRSLVEGRGAGNPAGLASWNPATQESVFFDNLETDTIVEEHDEVVIASAIATLEFLTAPPASGQNGGFGTADMDSWLWGLRHRVVFDSILAAFAVGNAAVNVIAKEFAIDTNVLPLADSFEEGDPRRFLRWFPRPGDLFGVDAAYPSFYGNNFDYTDGPVMRMSIELSPDGTVRGRNVVPAGQSGLNDSPYFADQAALWLANDGLPIQFAPADVAAAAVGREVLSP